MLEYTYIALLIFILGFGFLVFVHELGHFLVAKMVGIRATQFAIGFGQAILCWRKGIGLRIGTTEPEYQKRAIEYLQKQHGVVDTASQEDTESAKSSQANYSQYDIHKAADAMGLGETEYRLNWIPLGGYVKMLGQEDINPTARSEDPRSYNRKPIWARFCVISAGVIMNMITGLLFFILAFTIGVRFPSGIVGSVSPDSPAALTYPEQAPDNPFFQGFRLGDRVASVDGKPVTDMLDITVPVALGGDSTRTFVIDRPGLDEKLTYNITPRYLEHAGFMNIGMSSLPSLRIAAVPSDTALAEAGVQANMHITHVNGDPVEDYFQFHQKVSANRNKPSDVRFTHPQTEEAVSVMIENAPMLSTDTSSELMNLIGMVPATIVSGVREGMPADEAGVEPMDVIAELGGVSYPNMRQVPLLVQQAERKPISLVVLRDGERIDLGNITPNRDNLLGINLSFAVDVPIVSNVLANTPAASLQLTPGTRITQINGQPVQNWADMQALLADLSVLREDSSPQTPLPEGTKAIDITYVLNVPDQSASTQSVDVALLDLARVAAAQWSPVMDVALEFELVLVKASNPWQATALGFSKTNQFMIQTYQTIARLFDGTVAASNLRGPVGIVNEGTKFSQRGWGYLLFFLGLISVNLAVLNFLPLPIVDGGHALMLLYEKITGSPPSERFLTYITLLGLALLLTLFLYVTYHDLLRLWIELTTG